MPASNDSGADVQESGIDTCAICLQDIEQDEAFLDNCYHRFHWHVGYAALLARNLALRCWCPAN